MCDTQPIEIRLNYHIALTPMSIIHTGSSSWSSPTFSSSKNPPPVSMNLLPWILITLFSTESVVFLENKCDALCSVMKLISPIFLDEQEIELSGQHHTPYHKKRSLPSGFNFAEVSER